MDDVGGSGWGGPVSVQTVEAGPGDNEAGGRDTRLKSLLTGSTGWGGPASVQTVDAGPGDNEAGEEEDRLSSERAD